MLNIVVPMAGRGSRFAQAGYTAPKPLISVGGRPMIQWIIENITPSRPHRFHFLCLQEHLERYPDLEPTLRRICSGCTITPVREVTEGAACTVLLAREHIDNDEPLMIANSDQIVELNVDEYLAHGDAPGVAGLIMTFWADDPKWSFCRLREDGSVSEVVEKQVVSNEATVGIYNFSRGRDFVEAADAMIAQDLRVNGEFYVAPTYNQLIARGERVVVAPTGREYQGMYGLGIPADLQFFRSTPLYRAGADATLSDYLRELTEAYAWAFQAQRLDALDNLLTDSFVLVDPAGRFEGKQTVLKYIGDIFAAAGDTLRFEIVTLTVDREANRTVIEFRLEIGTKKLVGTDVIDWRNGQLSELRAYLY